MSRDGRLYPIPGEQNNEIELEDQDGTDIVRATATGLRLMEKKAGGDKWSEAMKVSDIKVSLFITDCRIALACSKYDKGGGWVGANPLVLPFNAVSKARAAVRRHGKMLVGQVRYPWLGLVGAAEKSGWLTNEQIQLFAKDMATKDSLLLHVTLPKATSAVKLASEVARRAAIYRLASEPDAPAASRDVWSKLTDPPPLHPPKGKYESHDLGAYWFAQPSHAYGPPSGSQVT